MIIGRLWFPIPFIFPGFLYLLLRADELARPTESFHKFRALVS